MNQAKDFMPNAMIMAQWAVSVQCCSGHGQSKMTNEPLKWGCAMVPKVRAKANALIQRILGKSEGLGGLSTPVTWIQHYLNMNLSSFLLSSIMEKMRQFPSANMQSLHLKVIL